MRELGSGHWLYQSEDTWAEDKQENESGQDTTEEQQIKYRLKSPCDVASDIINNIKKEVKEEAQKQLEEAEAEGMIEYTPPTKTWKTPQQCIDYMLQVEGLGFYNVGESWYFHERGARDNLTGVLMFLEIDTYRGQAQKYFEEIFESRDSNYYKHDTQCIMLDCNGTEYFYSEVTKKLRF